MSIAVINVTLIKLLRVFSRYQGLFFVILTHVLKSVLQANRMALSCPMKQHVHFHAHVKSLVVILVRVPALSV